MMTDSKVVQLFNSLDELITNKRENLYLDGLKEVLERIYFTSKENNDYGEFHDKVVKLRNELFDNYYTKKEIHRAIQLALLKGMKDEVQANHRMTPESIALFIGYLMQKLHPNNELIRLYNPACGTGNLLHTVLEQIEQPIDAYASEIDATLINISVIVANILEQNIEYFHQDSLRPLLLDPVDIVIADLPVGYYPDEERANQFELKADDGLSYSHHLFIEQSLTYTKPGGYLIFLIPEHLFISEQAEKLQQFLHEHTHIIGLFQLADSTFKAKDQRKSIFIIRKKGEGTKNVKQPLLVMLPSLKDTAAMENILEKINIWFEEEKATLS